MSKARDLTGITFGSLTVRSRAGSYLRDATWNCDCECGGTFVARSPHLLAGYTTCCGDREAHPRGRKRTSPDYVPSYNAAHAHVRLVKGSATGHTCHDCTEQAAEWSYNGMDPHEVVTAGGRRYSTDPDFYDARCRPCHRALDRTLAA